MKTLVSPAHLYKSIHRNIEIETPIRFFKFTFNLPIKIKNENNQMCSRGSISKLFEDPQAN